MDVLFRLYAVTGLSYTLNVKLNILFIVNVLIGILMSTTEF